MSETKRKPESVRLELTPEIIEALPAPAKRQRVYDAKQSGLYVVLQPATATRPRGKRSWYVAYRSPITGTATEYRLGPASVAPTSARKRAKAVLGKVADGGDPQAEKVSERRAKEAERRGIGTLEVYVRDHYWPDYLVERPSGKGTRERIEYAWPSLLKKKLAAITEMDIQRVKRERLAKVTPQTWNRDLAVLRACLNFAVEQGHLAVSPIRPRARAQEVDANRVRYLGQRDEVEDVRIEGRKVGEEERFWAALDRGPDYLRILVTLGMKTGARRGELFSLTWGAVSLEQGSVTLEAHTTKSRTKRTVPLPSTVVTMLRAWKPAGAAAEDFVVPSPVSGGRIYTLKKGWRALLLDAPITSFR